MSVLNVPQLLMGEDGYQISRSVRLRSSASAHFNRTPASAGNQKTWTWSGWVKKAKNGSDGTLFGAGTGASTYDICFFNSSFISNNDKLNLYLGNGSYVLVTTAVYRDPSAWYHVVVAIDSTQATASNRMKLYVNGVQITAFDTASYPAQNATVTNYWNTTTNQTIGGFTGYSGYYFDGYLTEVNLIDGQALTPSSFGETDAITGVWKPKKYAGTYGTNGFYLNFSDNSAATAAAIGKDSSGNGNNWTPNNISVTAGVTYDSMLDVPTPYADGGNGRGNYCVLNPLQTAQSATAPTNGNLTSPANTGVWRRIGATMQMPSSGKFYFEFNCDSYSTYPTFNIGVFSGNMDTTNNAIGYSATEWGYNGQSGYATNNNTNISSGFTTATTGDVLQLAYDASTGSIWFGKNNTWQGAGSPNPATGTSPTYTGAYNVTPVMIQNWATQSANFGQRPFTYTPPTGFKALNTQNLPDSTIKKGNQYFDVSTYTGNGISQNVVNSGGFQPDLVWTKGRSGASNHSLVDSVRGIALQLSSNQTVAEVSDATEITALNSNGFSVGNSSGAGYSTNANGTTYVGWQWKESATAGFDIVTYTGDATSARAINHSLGVAPKMVIVKSRSLGTENWNCWHTSLGNTAYRILLNTTGAVDTTSPTVWGTGGINPTSTTFQVGSASAANGSGATYVAYLFSEVAGYSKFGSYTGNGSTSADGPFVYCGFAPRFIMGKRSDSTGGWWMFDTARQSYNLLDDYLYANTSDAEQSNITTLNIDVLSNGFKIRSGTSPSTWVNANGGTYIFAAFAENPFKNSLAR